LKERRSIFQPDKSHFSHRLTRLGITKREAVLTIYLVTFSLSLAGTLVYYLNVTASVIVLVQCVALLLVIALLESAGKGRN
jgi:UDP-GlcNAc:undecaprenyl-phosphate GlcNAc-1-phosphate transferase